MIPHPVHLGSITDLPPLTWREIKYGYSQQFLGWRTVVELARERVDKGSTNPLEVELASLGKDQTWQVSLLLGQLADCEQEEGDNEIKQKWLFILLDWLYRRKDQFEDPLQEVEVLYADFGYPDELNKFVRFLPSTDSYKPETHSTEENVRRMYDYWREYLNSKHDLYFKI